MAGPWSLLQAAGTWAPIIVLLAIAAIILGVLRLNRQVLDGDAEESEIEIGPRGIRVRWRKKRIQGDAGDTPSSSLGGIAPPPDPPSNPGGEAP